MNSFDDVQIDPNSFSWKDIRGQDRWIEWTPAFTSLTVVGATTYVGRYRRVGRQCFFQVKFSAATSIESTAGTTYLTLPLTAKGVSGIATMTNDTAKTSVGVCHVDPTNSRCYLPSQTASGNIFLLAGIFEV